MPQDKQYRPLIAENGIQYLRTAELKVLAAIGKVRKSPKNLFDIVTIREVMPEESRLSVTSIAASISSLMQLGVIEDPIASTKNGFAYKLVSLQRYNKLTYLTNMLGDVWEDRSNYSKLLELYIFSKKLDNRFNQRHLKGMNKSFKDFLTKIPDLIVVTPATIYAPQTYTFTKDVVFVFAMLSRITDYLNKWRIDGIKVKERL